MKVERTVFPGWDLYPVYCCRSYEDWREVGSWMANNHVESFLVSSGSSGYSFQVRTKHDWFVLRWL